MKFIALLSCAAMSLAMALAPAGAAAQQVDLSPEMQVVVDEAEARGALLYRYDQAAWHGTDAFLEDFDQRRDGDMMRGYIIVKGEGNLLDAIFYGDVAGAMTEVARYTVDGNRVTRRQYHEVDARPLLSPQARRLAHVREIALEAAANEEIGMCADAVPNTVVLPPDPDGSIDVYLLTPPVRSGSYPLGGHYLFEVGADDTIIGWRRFLNTCFELALPGVTVNGDEPMSSGISHFLDPQPTEIHFFASTYTVIPLYVITTDNELVWEITGGVARGITRIRD